MLVNLNYRIGVHRNFAQSRISALVCSPQSEHVTTGGGAAKVMSPHCQSFQSAQINETASRNLSYFSF